MGNNRWLLIILIGVVLIGGAFFLLWPRGETAPEELVTVEETMPPTEAEVSETATNVVTETSSEAEAVPSTATEAVPPTPRAGLESTDPSSVNLASGDIQLVELFAFW